MPLGLVRNRWAFDRGKDVPAPCFPGKPIADGLLVCQRPVDIAAPVPPELGF